MNDGLWTVLVWIYLLPTYFSLTEGSGARVN
jgi:hypothetical protein